LGDINGIKKLRGKNLTRERNRKKDHLTTMRQESRLDPRLHVPQRYDEGTYPGACVCDIRGRKALKEGGEKVGIPAEGRETPPQFTPHHNGITRKEARVKKKRAGKSENQNSHQGGGAPKMEGGQRPASSNPVHLHENLEGL